MNRRTAQYQRGRGVVERGMDILQNRMRTNLDTCKPKQGTGQSSIVKRKTVRERLKESFFGTTAA